MPGLSRLKRELKIHILLSQLLENPQTQTTFLKMTSLASISSISTEDMEDAGADVNDKKDFDVDEKRGTLCSLMLCASVSIQFPSSVCSVCCVSLGVCPIYSCECLDTDIDEMYWMLCYLDHEREHPLTARCRHDCIV